MQSGYPWNQSEVISLVRYWWDNLRMPMTSAYSLRVGQNWPISSQSSMTFWRNVERRKIILDDSGPNRQRSNPTSMRQDRIVHRVIQVPWCEIDFWFDRHGRRWSLLYPTSISLHFSPWSPYWAEGTCWGASGTSWRRCTAWRSWLGTWSSQGHQQLIWWTMSLNLKDLEP